MTRRTPFIAAGIIGAVAVAAGPALGGMHTSAPKTQPAPMRLSDPALTCSQLTARFIKYLGPGMQTQLTTFVSPAFVIERNDGSTDSSPTYLQNHPVFTGWNITIKTAQYSSPVLTCGALTSTTQVSADGPPAAACACPAARPPGRRRREGRGRG